MSAGSVYVAYFVAISWKNTLTVSAQISRKRVCGASVPSPLRSLWASGITRAKLHGKKPMRKMAG